MVTCPCKSPWIAACDRTDALQGDAAKDTGQQVRRRISRIRGCLWHTMDAGDLAIMSVPAKLATAALCLLGRVASAGRNDIKPSRTPLTANHVARQMPSVM